MKTRLDFSNYLRNHDPSAAQPAAPAAVPASPAGPTAMEIATALAESKVALKKIQDDQAAREAAAAKAAEEAAKPAAPPPAVQIDQNILLSAKIEELSAQLKASQAEQRASEKAAKKERLEAYRQTVLAAYATQTGRRINDAYVYGSTNEEIDQTAKVAFQDILRIEAETAERLNQERASADAAAATAGTRPIPQTQVVGLPSHVVPAESNGGPRATVAASPLTQEQYDYLMTPDAARNGDYAKYRGQVAAHIRATRTPAGVPAPQMPGTMTHGLPGQQPVQHQTQSQQTQNPVAFGMAGLGQLQLGGVTQPNPAPMGPPQIGRAHV